MYIFFILRPRGRCSVRSWHRSITRRLNDTRDTRPLRGEKTINDQLSIHPPSASFGHISSRQNDQRGPLSPPPITKIIYCTFSPPPSHTHPHERAGATPRSSRDSGNPARCARAHIYIRRYVAAHLLHTGARNTRRRFPARVSLERATHRSAWGLSLGPRDRISECLGRDLRGTPGGTRIGR